MNIQLGKLAINWNRGNDRFVRTNANWFRQLFGLGSEKAQFEVVQGNEAELYDTTGEINIVFNRFASMFSNGIYQELDKDGKVIEKSELVKLLLNPNPLLDGKSFMIQSALHYLIFGNRITYPLKGTELSALPSVLWNLPPNEVKIELTGKMFEQMDINGIIKRYYIDNRTNSDKKEWLASELIHHRRVDPMNPIIGRSVLESLHMTISNIRAAHGLVNVLYTKKGALGFYSSQSKDSMGNSLALSEADRIALAKQDSEEYGIFNGQSSIKMVNGDVKWNSTTLPVKDFMTFETISEGIKRLIDAINLNDNIFSKEKSKIQANLKEGLKMAYQDGIQPFAEDFCNNMTNGLFLKDGHKLVISYDHISALQSDSTTDVEIAEKKANAIKTYIDAGYSAKDAERLVMETY
jgi:hypothetical protein